MAKPMTTKDKIREWISDNLRYMLLIGAILLNCGSGSSHRSSGVTKKRWKIERRNRNKQQHRKQCAG